MRATVFTLAFFFALQSHADAFSAFAKAISGSWSAGKGQVVLHTFENDKVKERRDGTSIKEFTVQQDGSLFVFFESSNDEAVGWGDFQLRPSGKNGLDVITDSGKHPVVVFSRTDKSLAYTSTDKSSNGDVSVYSDSYQLMDDGRLIYSSVILLNGKIQQLLSETLTRSPAPQD